jgi:hypothetical protein
MLYYGLITKCITRRVCAPNILSRNSFSNNRQLITKLNQGGSLYLNFENIGNIDIEVTFHCYKFLCVVI